MVVPAGREMLRTQWRLMLVGGHVSDILIDVNARLQEAQPVIRPFLLCWQATAYNHLGRFAAAVEAARDALQEDTSNSDQKTIAQIYANIGIAHHGVGMHDAEAANFEIAERILRE